MTPRFVPLAAIALAALGLAAPAVADGGHRRSLTLTATSTNTAPLVQHPPSCDASGQCVGSYSSANTMTGDLIGTLVVEGNVQFVLGRTTAQQHNLQLFEGTVAGCGRGSFVMVLPLQPISLVGPSVARASIVDGSGTGDLARLRGTVEASFTPSPQGGGVGGYTLKVRC